MLTEPEALENRLAQNLSSAPSTALRARTSSQLSRAQSAPPNPRSGLPIVFCALVLAGFDAPAELVSSFQAGDSGWHLGTLGLGQLDSSPDLEIIVPYRDSSGHWFLDAFKFNGQRLPGFPYSAGTEEINVSPTLYDLDHDGRDEIIFTRGNHVIALRGDGSVFWSNTVNSTVYVPNGGYQTVTNGFYWSATGQFISRLPTNAVFSSQVSPPMVVDLAGNGSNEVVTAWKIQPDPTTGAQDFNPFINDIFGSGEWGTMGETWSGGVVSFDALTGKQKFVYHLHQLVESGLAAGRPAFDRATHLYALNDSDSVVAFDKSQPFGLWGKGMLYKQFGKNQRLMTGSYLVPIDIYTADLNGDGLDEVLVAGTQLSSMWQPNETVLEHDGAILWRQWLPHVDLTNNFGWNNSACLIPINPDHDNHIDVLGFNHGHEISFRYWNGIELVERPGWPKSFYPLVPTPPVVGDVDGDGAEEIIIGTYNPAATPSSGSLLVYSLDGTLKLSVPVPGGIKQIPALGDVEGTGRVDVVYRSLQGQVYVQNFGATTTNNVSWATHRGNMHRDGNHGRALFPPGTPMVPNKVSGYNRASFAWMPSPAAEYYRVFRAEQASGPFLQLVTLLSNVNAYTDYNLKPGCQYFYEVAAVSGTNSILSAPFAILSLFNSNLVANSGFEENENSHWDKWFTGSIDMTNMTAVTTVAWQGNQSMRIVLTNQGNNSTIAQFNQYGIPDSTIFATPGAFYSFGGYFKSGGITQPSEHWLEWSSTKTGTDTNTRPALPWPYYFTTHFVAGTNASDWTYVNRTFQLPAGFPNIELRHVYTIAAPGSGSIYLDNVFFRQLPSPAATNWTTWIPFGSTWRYFTNTPATNWSAAEFNDTGWLVGTAKFGAGSGPTNITTRLPQQRPAYYFRKQFFLPSSASEELLLAATCTDDSGAALFPLRVFLNGNEVKSTIDTVTGQGNEIRYFDLTPFADLIQPGTNVIAVQVSNYWSSWDDVAFDISLKAVPSRATIPLLSVQCPYGIPQVTVQTPANSIWKVESCDVFPGGSWQIMHTFTNLVGGFLTIPDTGQNGRALPAGTASRFYRLVPY